MSKKFIYGALGLSALAAVIAVPIYAGGGHGNGWHDDHDDHGEYHDGHGDYHDDHDRHGYGHGRHGYGVHLLSDRKIDKLSRRLNLDAAQQDALFSAADEARAMEREVRQQLRESRRILSDLDANAADYADQVAEMAKQNGDLASRMTTALAEMKSKLAAVLTEAQMDELMERLL